jgi:hypothetical protein
VLARTVSSGVSRGCPFFFLLHCLHKLILFLPPFSFADDTGQEHIITNATFRNCGARLDDNAYETSSSTRGCDTTSQYNGCWGGSSVWGLLTHSDQFTPEIMQATRDITYVDCGRRFKLADFTTPPNDPSTVSGRIQNWYDADGSASGLNEPTIIGSGLADAGHWWKVDSNVVDDSDGPLT